MASNSHVLPSWFDVWSERLDDTGALDKSFEVLSQEERVRARSFRFELDRVRFAARRAFVRRVLALYVGVSPADIRIRIAPLGKPGLEPPCGVFFNTSHSDGLAVVAIAYERGVGIDIERVRPIPGVMELAERYFAPEEVRLLQSTAAESRAEVFFKIWTRKESYAKAIGAGLYVPFESFDVSEDDRGVGSPRGPRGGSRFIFADLDTPDGFAGAVTMSGAASASQGLVSRAGAA